MQSLMEDNLDESVNEVLSEINELAYSVNEGAEYTDTLENGINLEQEQAQELYDQIEKETTPESSIYLFPGFDGLTSTPNEESENLATGKTSKVSSLVQGFETLHTSSETKPKKESREQTEHKRKIKTRTVAKEEESSPLSVLEPKKRRTLTASRRLHFGNIANVDIPSAKRLNPQETSRGWGIS